MLQVTAGSTGAHVKNIIRKLPGLVCLSDFYPSPIVQAGSNEVVQRSLQAIKKDVRALGQLKLYTRSNGGRMSCATRERKQHS